MLRRSLTILALFAALAAVGVAGASASDAPAPLSAPHRQAIAAAPAPLSAPHRLAIAAARELLATLPLPPGATPASSPPTGNGQPLAAPVERLFFAAQAARHRFWSSSSSPASVLSFVRAHLPPGSRWSGSGFSGDGTFSFGSYVPATARGLGLRDALVSVGAAAPMGGPTIVRADAYVHYVSPRPSDERLEGRAEELDITITDGLEHRLGALTVTRRSVVRRLAALVDALPAAGLQGLAFSCPADLLATPIDHLVFRAAPSGPAFASITIRSDTPTDPSPCYASPLRVNRRTVGDMYDGGRVLALADRLLGLRLARR